MLGSQVSFTRLLNSDGRAFPISESRQRSPRSMAIAAHPGERRLGDRNLDSPLRQIQTFLVDAIGGAPECRGSDKPTTGDP